MKAGRELDALVAEKVFGYIFADAFLAHYSTDIADAWLVVEHMRTHVPDYCALRMETVPVGYMVAFYSHKNRLDRVGAFVSGPAPLAICLAALKALGVEVEE